MFSGGELVLGRQRPWNVEDRYTHIRDVPSYRTCTAGCSLWNQAFGLYVLDPDSSWANRQVGLLPPRDLPDMVALN